MVSEVFMNAWNKVSSIKTRTVFEDYPDRLSSTISVFILILFSSIVTAKSYFLNPLICYVQAFDKGLNIEGFVEAYCWTHGTYYLLEYKTMFKNKTEWKKIEGRVDYYQWIPFILLLQMICFFWPRSVWNYFTFQAAGFDMETQFRNHNLKLIVSEEESDTLARVINNIVHKARKASSAHQHSCVFPFNSGLVCKYFLVKFLYLSNCLCQLLCIHELLGFGNSMSNFIIFIKHYLENYDNWNGSKYFPRVSLCLVDNVIAVGPRRHGFVVQCVLSVNIICEKIFMFLWIWTLLVLVMTFYSIISWCLSLSMESCRPSLVKGLFASNEIVSEGNAEEFIHNYLHGNGLFILIMLNLNLNRDLLLKVFRKLWEYYERRRKSDGVIYAMASPTEIIEGDIFYV